VKGRVVERRDFDVWNGRVKNPLLVWFLRGGEE